LINQVTDKESYRELYKKYTETKDIYKYLYFKKYGYRGVMNSYNIDLRGTKGKSIYKLTCKQLDFIKFIRLPNVHITNENWSVVFDSFKGSRESIIFFDPPYLMSCNDYYPVSNGCVNVGNSVNVYQYFWKNKLSSFKPDIYFMLESNWIINLLFENFIIHEYPKMYNATKKMTTHVIISNT